MIYFVSKNLIISSKNIVGKIVRSSSMETPKTINLNNKAYIINSNSLFSKKFHVKEVHEGVTTNKLVHIDMWSGKATIYSNSQTFIFNGNRLYPNKWSITNMKGQYVQSSEGLINDQIDADFLVACGIYISSHIEFKQTSRILLTISFSFFIWVTLIS